MINSYTTLCWMENGYYLDFAEDWQEVIFYDMRQGQTTGKKNGAGADMKVWEGFVAGTDPTDVNYNFFRVSVEMP